MNTRVVKIDPQNIDHEALRAAGALIRNGGLVAFPTETVYGLGANGLDPGAVKRFSRPKAGLRTTR